VNNFQTLIVNKTIQVEMNVAEAKVIDLRTPMEFAGGHVEKSINTHLDTIPQKINKIFRNKRTSCTLLCFR